MPKGKKIEPLDLEELENNPSLNGMLAHLESLPTSAQQARLSPTDSAPIGLTPVDLATAEIRVATKDLEGIERLQLPSSGEPETSYESAEMSHSPIGLAPTSSASIGSGSAHVRSEVQNTSQIDLNEVLAELATTPQPSRSRGKIVPATRVEHGHSATQDALYWYLWRVGKSVKGSRSHFVQAGYGQIQAGLGVDRSNVQDAIRELQKKLAIRIVKANTVGSATVYEVFCCDDILAKRKEAKLMWARTYGKRRVDLINEAEAEAEGNKLTPLGLMPIGSAPPELQPIDVIESVGARPTAPVGFTPTEGIGVTPIQTVKEASSKRETTSDTNKLREFMEQQLGLIDDDAARRLIIACQLRAGKNPVTVDQIISVVMAKLPATRKARNPVGLLIEAVPKHFPLSKHAEKAVCSEESANQREYWERIIASPDAPETLKEEARRLLDSA
jgi:hypothetical protein